MLIFQGVELLPVIFRNILTFFLQRLIRTYMFSKKTNVAPKNTPPKINIEPENDGLEDGSPLPGGPVFSGSSR